MLFCEKICSYVLSNYFAQIFSFRFDLEEENKGADVQVLKELAILHNLLGYIEDWENDKWLNDTAMNKVLVSNKYHDFILPLK